ncbi:TolC family protein [Pseudobacter ginsenosidimutans]|uniref:Outer membrane protein TolC n=1 Tax=Pseudobacter ginsenosidimutans TaxID=661488 RepID=A0A4V2F180_9BACT|nr:TolC family protein [Pseudobacter ginsenosidimutans]QEC40583.1 TolC family protein [Pseudobacter ginsenosidimutans]RZS72701.1 outer membrane protein TolC [Pseudobacter ginsenosidimutans]
MNKLNALAQHKWKVIILSFLVLPQCLQAQETLDDSTLLDATIENVVRYAIKNQPAVQKALINEAVTETTIKGKLADWYPQLNAAYNLQHNFKVQTAVIGGNPVKLGVDNVSAIQLTATQNIFNRDALLASQTAGDVRRYARQNTGATRIDVAANVSKAFYDVLTTKQQIKTTSEDISRLERSLRDATYQYQAGITDKTDYKRATIALNNAKALLKSNEELLKAKIEYLKALMGYPVNAPLEIKYDTLQMENQIVLDTLQATNYASRIEYQLLETQYKLQQANLKYNKWSFIPNVSANGAYNFNYQNDQFSKLYNTNYPQSFVNLSVTVPLFQGGKRIQNIRNAELQLDLLEADMSDLRNNINAEYSQALASYKANLASYLALKENLDLAQEVYDVINLQYRSGVKTYLEVITAETDLRTARINYYNALYQLLSAKIDVQRALGQINY